MGVDEIVSEISKRAQAAALAVCEIEGDPDVKFTEITEQSAGAQKGMFVSAFIAVRSLLITFANNIGGSLYVKSPTLPFAAELCGIAVWLALFVLFALRVRKKTAASEG